MDMYLTGKVDLDTAQNIALNNAGSDYDAMTGLRSRTHYGRPAWHRDIFGPIKKLLDTAQVEGMEASIRCKVGVFYCKFRIRTLDL